MFKHRQHFGHGPHFGRHAHGFGHHGPSGAGRGGRGGRMGRFFEQGDLRLVVLKLISDQPRHGYELIKSIEESAGGAYSPSPGVIYPTLTLLEELGYATATETAGKKLFTITAEGEAYLAGQAEPVQSLFARMAEVAASSAAFAPQILRARENLRTALRMKLTAGKLSSEQVSAVARVLDDAARAIDEV